MMYTHAASADQCGNTPLHYAAHANHLDTVIKLLKDGSKILSTNGSGLTPLHFAAFGGNVQVLETFISESPHVINLQSIKGSSLLHEAVRGKSIETVKFLLSKGANTNLQDQEGNTPLHLAAVLTPASLSVTICQTLLEQGSNPSIQNMAKENFVFTVLRGSVKSSEILISLALKHHPDLLSRNSVGLTALDLARKISAPPAVIRCIQEKTQEQQMFFLSQRHPQLSNPVSSEHNLRPDESVSSKEIPIMEAGSWRPGKKVKLFICGHSGVGKTTFANALRETGLLSKLQYYLTGPKTPLSTKGVSCSQTDIKDCSLVIWDFAGQMEYCFTHSLLLNTSGPNTVYCVIFSLKGIESDLHGGQRHALEQLMFWLRFLSVTHNSQSLPHVFLIGSFLDALPEENNEVIAKQFYENVMKKEIKLFNCFQKQFFAINCRNMTDLEPIREALAKTVTQILQNSKDDTVPEICQMVIKQVLHLRAQKVRFQRLNEFAENIQQNLLMPVSPTTLLTAVEYLHNISELLYLPHCFSSRICSTANLDQKFTSEVQSDSVSPSNALSSGVVILDLEWLLQDIFARFGNFALSPASGTNKERRSFEEVVAALNLTDGEGDAETALELLEAFDLLLKTPEGEFVVPGWLKRGGPERYGPPDNLLRGVVYRWKDGSRGLFSHFLVGRLQIQLMRVFGSNSCQLWKEGALLVTKAQLRVEVSEDKRSLYLTGSWRGSDTEGDCYNLLEKVGKEVEILLQNELEQHYEKLHLCPTELYKISVASRIDKVLVCILKEPLSAAITEELCGFSFEQILEAVKTNSSLCCRCGDIQPWEVLFSQHDTRMLASLGINCSTRWLEGVTLTKLCCLLDTPHPLALDWKRLAELLGEATNSVVLEIEGEARKGGLSPTSLVLNKYPVSLEQLRQSLSQIEREDCIAEIDNMMKQLCH